MGAAVAALRTRIPGLDTVVFGDLFLADIRAYRERTLARIGMRGLFPLWLRDTRALAHEFVRLGYRAVLVCVDSAQLAGGFAGREFDADLLHDFPRRSIRAGRTASSTPSCMRGRASARRCGTSGARSWSGTAASYIVT